MSTRSWPLSLPRGPSQEHHQVRGQVRSPVAQRRPRLSGRREMGHDLVSAVHVHGHRIRTRRLLGARPPGGVTGADRTEANGVAARAAKTRSGSGRTPGVWRRIVATYSAIGASRRGAAAAPSARSQSVGIEPIVSSICVAASMTSQSRPPGGLWRTRCPGSRWLAACSLTRTDLRPTSANE